MRRPGALIATLALLALPVLASCGDEEDASSDRAGRPPAQTITDGTDDLAPAETGPEDADPLPKLPAGWGREINEGAGFAIGVPPRWTAAPSPAGQGTVLSSPDELALISITADRTAGALELPLGEFARRTAEALGTEVAGAGRFTKLEIDRPRPFGHRYDAAAVEATGTPVRSGVHERIMVAVIRRDGYATYIVVVRSNAKHSSPFADEDTFEQAIRSLRGRPAG
jgi:hypothetical protein